MTFPKLKYPILTRGMQPEHRLILLAYDMIYRLRNAVDDNMEFQKFSNQNATEILSFNDKHDIGANLSNLGYYIEHVIFNGDCSAVFEPDQQIEFTSNHDIAEKE